MLWTHKTSILLRTSKALLETDEPWDVAEAMATVDGWVPAAGDVRCNYCEEYSPLCEALVRDPMLTSLATYFYRHVDESGRVGGRAAATGPPLASPRSHTRDPHQQRTLTSADVSAAGAR